MVPIIKISYLGVGGGIGILKLSIVRVITFIVLTLFLIKFLEVFFGK
jgi:hypothetical protein